MTPQELKLGVFQLALQGKLSNRNCNDSSVFDLIESLPINKKKKYNDVLDEEKPFDIPETWQWIRLGRLIDVISGVSYDKGHVTHNGLRILRGGNIQNNVISINDDDVFLPTDYFDEEKTVRAGDTIIVASTGSKEVIGKPGFVREPLADTMIGAFLRICRPKVFEMNNYLNVIFQSNLYRKRLRDLSQGTNINNVKESYITELPVPLPPLEEQKRIVEKIEELLPLVDRYEKAWNKLEKFNEKFPVDMEKSLLVYAASGKLTSHLESDGCAKDILLKTEEKKNSLYKQGLIKKAKQFPAIHNDEMPFELPSTWTWCRVSDVCYQIFAGGDKPVDFSQTKDENRTIPVVANGVTNDGIIGYTKVATAKKNTITVAGRGTIGFSVFRNYDYCPIVRLIVLEQSDYVDPKYLQIVLNAFPESGLGTSIPQLTVPMLAPKLIPLPPLDEQKRIVAKLEELLPLCRKLVK